MAFVDPYFDENIGDLRNLLGAKSSKNLKELEPQVVFANELELESVGIPRTNDLTELLLDSRFYMTPRGWIGDDRLYYLDIETSRPHGQDVSLYPQPTHRQYIAALREPPLGVPLPFIQA